MGCWEFGEMCFVLVFSRFFWDVVIFYCVCEVVMLGGVLVWELLVFSGVEVGIVSVK